MLAILSVSTINQNIDERILYSTINDDTIGPVICQSRDCTHNESFTQSVSHSLTHSVTYWLTNLLTHSTTHRTIDKLIPGSTD